VVLVSRAEAAALREAERTRAELAELGVANLQLAINGYFQPTAPGDPVADAMARRGAAALAAMPLALAALPSTTTAFLARGTVGLDALRGLGTGGAAVAAAAEVAAVELPPGLAGLVGEFAALGRGVIMTMGKGGVGKTTIAAAIALALAQRGHRVHLSTTDPAAHVAEAVADAAASAAGQLRVSRIDPATEVARYTAEVLEKAGSQLDAAGRALLEEDLRSPCTEEIAVFRAFAQAVAEGRDGFVVLDTAPTGHTLLLLDAAEAYHREVLRTRGEMPESVVELLPRLRDPAYTRILIVTLAEATPVHEAERLQADLARAGIHPHAWVINQSLRASGTGDPLLRLRGEFELPYIRQVTEQLAPRTALIPWLAEAPVGRGLRQVVA
jgi:arsenite-transporting ATPase